VKADHSLSCSGNGAAGPSQQALANFRAAVMRHFQEHGRDLPWRRTRDPYLILVSEMMLQQTQVARVIDKYELFARLFPTLDSLASAATADVLRAWQGLGYNRRGLNLQRSARLVVSEFGGSVPDAFADLLRLPGVGRATAAAVCAFAFGIPVPFLETNIRSAYIHHFFQECSRVSDADLLPLVESTLDRANPRDWYYALMDYGTWLKKVHPNPSRRSSHETTQSLFPGSHRQLRSALLRAFLARTPQANGETGPRESSGLDPDAFAALAPEWHRDEVQAALEEMTREGFLRSSEGLFELA
jgi:A/G-specific adenine glycosylase